jgi:hypothetical protein
MVTRLLKDELVRGENVQGVVVYSTRYSNTVLEEVNKTTLNLSKGKVVLIEIQT